MAEFTDETRRQTYSQGWTMYPLCCAGHHAQGLVAALGVLLGNWQVVVAALFWTTLYIAYQALSVLRKQDSPGLDVADYLAGAGAGVGIAAAYLLLFV